MYVATIEKRQGLKIAAPEEIAFRYGYTGATDLERLIEDRYPRNDYGRSKAFWRKLEGRTENPSQMCRQEANADESSAR